MNKETIKKFYIDYEGIILFTILSVWCIACGLMSVPFTIVMIGAGIPGSIALYKFITGMHEIIMENLTIYINLQEGS